MSMDHFSRSSVLKRNRLHKLRLEILKQLGQYPLDITPVRVSRTPSSKLVSPRVSVRHVTGQPTVTHHLGVQSSSHTSPASGTLGLFPTGTIPMFTWRVNPTTLGAK